MIKIKNLKKAADRILKAIKQKEKIILYGDSDLDGISSVVITKEAIESLGGEIAAFYFPDRETEGYGITLTGLKYLKKMTPALLVVLDLGISNFKETILAKKMGFEVVMIDHHEILGKLPKAKIIVNPKQKGDESFKFFAAAGLAFKLSEAMHNGKMPEVLREDSLVLAALATIADMMPQVSENKNLIEKGMFMFERTERPGLKVFFNMQEINARSELSQKTQKIISILNARGSKDGLPANFKLLISDSLSEAGKIMKILLTENRMKREKIEKVIKIIEEKVAQKTDSIIFEGDSDFGLETMSSPASILSGKYSKPAFLFKKMKDVSQGTVRAPSNVNIVELMKKCAKCLITFGGHPQAAGFRVENKNLEKFKKCLIKNFKPE